MRINCLLLKKCVLAFVIILALFILQSSVVKADDEYEPNDTFFDPPELTEGTYSNLNCSDEDWFQVNVSADTTIRVTITFDSLQDDIDLELYNDSLDFEYLGGSYGTSDSEQVEYYSVWGDICLIHVFNTTIPSNSPMYELNIEFFSGNLTESITVTSPTSSDTWEEGNTYTITWDSKGTFSSIYIALYDDSFNHVTNIASGTAGDGSYAWTVPSDIATGIYQIAVGDNSDMDPIDFSDLFTITGSGQADSITVTNPTSSDNWLTGTTHAITWDAVGSFTTVDISLLDESDTLISEIASGTENDGSYIWTVPFDLVTDTYKVLIYDNIHMEPYDYSNLFTITYQEDIEITTPNFTSIWNNGSIYNIEWNSMGDITHVNISLYNSSGFIEDIILGTANDDVYAWTVPDNLRSGSDYYINISDSIDGDPLDVSNGFAINNTKSPIEIIILDNPVHNSVFYRNVTNQIHWVWSGSIPRVNVSLYNSENEFILRISSNITNCGECSWDIPAEFTKGDYYIIVEDALDGTPYGNSTFFSIQDQPITSNGEEEIDEDDKGEDTNNPPFIPGYSLTQIIGFIIIGNILAISLYWIKTRKYKG